MNAIELRSRHWLRVGEACKAIGVQAPKEARVYAMRERVKRGSSLVLRWLAAVAFDYLVDTYVPEAAEDLN